MILVESLVVYKNKAAVVNEIGEKLDITVLGGETIRVRDKDLLLLHEGPASIAALEKELHGDVKGTWDLLEDETVSLRELAELIFGEWTAAAAWNAYLLLKDGLYFSGSIEEVRRRDPASVASEEEKRARKKVEAAERRAFLARLADGSVEPEQDTSFLQELEVFALGKSNRSRLLREAGKPETPIQAHKLLLSTGFWDIRTNPHPSRFGIDKYSASAPVDPPPLAHDGRLDLRHLKAFAIDNVWTDDPDDAVSIEGDVIWVHVADPAVSVMPGSPADEEASGRGATLYLPEGPCRMLRPDILPFFALGLDKNSPALSFKMTLNPDGSIAATEIFSSIVAVTKISYAQADASSDPDMQALFDFAACNQKRRLAASAVILHFPEVHIAVSDSDITIEEIPSYRSAAMVRECMLLAGEGAATWAIQRQLAFPFVTQEAGDFPNSRLPGLAGFYQLRRCMRSRVVSTKPGAHQGLGLTQYAQVTSPLRRYTDLLAHQQIRAALCGQKPLDTEAVQLRLGIADAGASALIRAERASKLHWTCVYLSDKKDSLWQGVILEQKNNGFVVFIPALGLETLVITRTKHALNDQIPITLQSVKIPELEFNFTTAL
ncbi:MAG: RNB domain-containing ribonuclease [Spirochaetaceae bacterium]|jgi:exoribonuclease-2|nr:RNB domain-containing ribonuclease [Spirochaetaceae bacterium]